MVDSSKPLVVTSPKAKEKVGTSGVRFTGTGALGEVVELRDSSKKLLGTTTIDNNGGWSITTDLPAGVATYTASTPTKSTPVEVEAVATVISSAVWGPEGMTVRGRTLPGVVLKTTNDPAFGWYDIENGQVTADKDRAFTLVTRRAIDGKAVVAAYNAADTQVGRSAPVTPTWSLVVHSPAPNALVGMKDAVFTGWAQPGSTVQITDANKKPVGSAVADASGNWSTTLELPDGPATLTFTSGSATASWSGVVFDDSAELKIMSPENGGTVATKGVKVTGTGEPGQTVEVRDSAKKLLGTGVIDDKGAWSVVIDLPAGSATLTATAGTRTATVNVTAVAPVVHPIPAASGSALPGQVTGELKIYDSSTTVNGVMTITAPSGTTIGSVRDNFSAAGVEYPVDPNGATTVTGTKSTTYGGGSATVWVTLNVPAGTKPGTVFSGGSAVVNSAAGEPVARGELSVYAQGTIPAASGSAVRGGTTQKITIYDPSLRTDGQMTITAPTGTTIVSAENSGNTWSYPDGTTAVGSPGSWYGGSGNRVYVTLKVAEDAKLGAVLTGGTATVRDANGMVLTTGSLSVTVAAAPLDVTSPKPGDTVTTGPNVTVTGSGEPGEKVTVTGPDGNTIGETTVDEDGSWEVSVPLPGGGSITVGSGGQEVVIEDLTVKRPMEVTSPKPGDTVTTGPNVVVTGSGEPGEKVTVTGPDGNPIGETIVDGNGDWEVTVPLPGGGSITVGSGGQETVIKDLTVIAELVITSPVKGEDGAAAVGTQGVVFTGTGQPGQGVEVRDADGTVLAAGVIDADGGWSVTVPSFPEGPGTVTVVSGEQSIPFDFVAVTDEEGTPLVDPLIGGFAVLSALAGVGVFGVRRRLLADVRSAGR